MRRIAAFLAGHFTICGLAFAAAQDLPYPGDPAPGEEMAGKTYIALRGSLTFDGKGAGVTVPTTPAATSLRPSHDVGGGGVIALGAELPYDFRVEVEGSYRHKPVKNVSLGGVLTPATGYVETAAPMLNLLWAPKFDGMPIRPVLGGGVGMAYTQSRINGASLATTYLSNAGWHFAYQGIAGVEIPLAPGAAFTANYRWMHTDNVRARCGTGGAATLTCTKIGFNDQGVDMGVKLDLN
jgi:opacity protein-like surface antigen